MMGNAGSRRPRQPYHSPAFKSHGKLSEAAYELLTSLTRESVILPHGSQQEPKSTLDLLARLGLAETWTDVEDDTHYRITELGEQVLIARNRSKAGK